MHRLAGAWSRLEKEGVDVSQEARAQLQAADILTALLPVIEATRATRQAPSRSAHGSSSGIEA
jgi:hypothetical protein